MSEAMRVLEASSSFCAAAPATREQLARNMRRRRYPASQVMFWEGDRGGHAYLVQSGNVWLTAETEDGTSRFVADMGPGTLVGEHTALTGRRRITTALARSEVVAWEMEADCLRQALLTDAALCFDAFMNLVDLILSKNTERVLWERLTTKQKVASVLLRQLKKPEGAGDIVRLTQEDLGRMVGATRESVTRSLSSLRGRGVIETGARSIRVLDRNALGKYSGQS